MADWCTLACAIIPCMLTLHAHPRYSFRESVSDSTTALSAAATPLLLPSAATGGAGFLHRLVPFSNLDVKMRLRCALTVLCGKLGVVSQLPGSALQTR